MKRETLSTYSLVSSVKQTNKIALLVMCHRIDTVYTEIGN